MKKIRMMSWLLSVLLMAQSLVMPTGATAQNSEPSTAATEPAGPVAMVEPTVPEPTETPFGKVCVQKGCRTIEGMVPLGGSEPKLETAASVFLYEMNTDTVVYAYNPDMPLPPGNLAKLVTGIVTLNFCKMDDMVTVKEGIKGRLPISSLTIGLTNNEVISVRDLLHALILTDANDAAVVLAEHISGTRQGFVPLMNEWVKSIGCTNTEFATVHGVDGAASKTSARDMAKIVRAAIANEDFAEVFNAASYDIEPTNVNNKKRSLKSYNYMRDDGTITQFHQKRVTGGMASYETTSGACLVLTSQQNNMRYISVVMGCHRTFAANGWQPTNYGNFEEMSELLKFGYDNYKVNRIVYEGMTMSQFAVNNGESNAVGQARVNIDSVVPITAQMKNLTVNYDLDGYLTAPIEKGKRIATVELWYRNSCLAEAEVFAVGDVKPADDTGVVIHSKAAQAAKSGAGIWGTLGTICVIALGLAGVYLGYNSYMRAKMRARRRRRRAERRRTK